MDNNNTNIRENEEKQLLTFLQRTKDGEYAKIDKNSLNYIRIKESGEEQYDFEEEYYYSIR